MSGASEDHREQLCKEIRLLDDRFSAEETDLLEKRAEIEELLKEISRTTVEEWRTPDAVWSDVAQKATSGAKDPRLEVGLAIQMKTEQSKRDERRQRMWERFTIKKKKKRWAPQLLEEEAKVVQVETDSSWQNESPFKEELELLRMGNDLRLEGSSMRQAFKAGNSGRLGGISGKSQARRMVKREIARMVQRSGARRRGSEEHCAVDLAKEHGLSEANRSTSRRTGRRHTVVCVP